MPCVKIYDAPQFFVTVSSLSFAHHS
eukprot:COSAG06_NODE_30465_length_538_cov_1.225513_1_plen_25_part_01